MIKSTVVSGGDKGGTNGQYDLRWKFELEKTYDHAVVLIQKIDCSIQTGICKCEKNNGGKVLRKGRLGPAKTASYYEVIGFIDKGKTTIAGTDHRGFRNPIIKIHGAMLDMGRYDYLKKLPVTATGGSTFDDQWRGPRQKKCTHGKVTMTGEIKAFKITRALIDEIQSWKEFRGVKGILNPEQLANVSPGLLYGRKISRAQNFSTNWWNKSPGGTSVYSPVEVGSPRTRIFQWDCVVGKEYKAEVNVTDPDENKEEK